MGAYKLDPLVSIDNGVPYVFDAMTMAQISWTISGSWSGTIDVYGSVDGDSARYDSLTFINQSNGARVQHITGNGQWTVPDRGYRFFKFEFTSWTSGTATLTVYSIDTPFFILENYQITDISSNTISASTIKNQLLRNAVTRGIIVQVIVTAVTGTVNWPTMSMYQTLNGQEIIYAGPRTKAGTISAGQSVTWLIYPGAFGGSFDLFDSCPLPRSPTLRLNWTLPGGASVTYVVQDEYLL